MLGNNYRMTDVLAALGIEQLKRVDWLLGEKEKIAKRYTEAFSKTNFIKPPYVPDYVDRHSWYMYSITVDRSKRDPLLEHLKKENIDTRLSFPPVHIQPYYAKLFGYQPKDLPVSWDTFCRFLDIPIWAGLQAKTQNYIVSETITALKCLASERG